MKWAALVKLIQALGPAFLALAAALRYRSQKLKSKQTTKEESQ